MSAVSVVRDYYRPWGHSWPKWPKWPKAILSATEIQGRLGWALRDVGWAILHAGGKVLNQRPPTSMDRAFHEGMEYEQRTAQRKTKIAAKAATV